MGLGLLIAITVRNLAKHKSVSQDQADLFPNLRATMLNSAARFMPNLLTRNSILFAEASLSLPIIAANEEDKTLLRIMAETVKARSNKTRSILLNALYQRPERMAFNRTLDNSFLANPQ